MGLGQGMGRGKEEKEWIGRKEWGGRVPERRGEESNKSAQDFTEFSNDLRPRVDSQRTI